MSITNTPKPTTSITNTTKASIAEQWATITTTWASETRTWADCVSLIDNTTKTAYGDPLWNSQLVWQMNFPWQANSSIMTNVEKP